ncbi:MAG: alpha/beta fold hydrolase [Burkholderiaceae bacterium]|nr:alpha/beta fold hydrolase [Burkholderiaceae bacterium]
MTTPQVRCAYADTPAGQIHYRVLEEGADSNAAPLLLLHPAPRSSLYFKRVLPLLRGMRAIAPDLPGFGGSYPLPAGATMNTLAGGIVDCLDALGVEKAHVFGIHSGNKVGAALAAGWPERVRSFMFAGMTHSIIPDAARRNEAVRAYVAAKPALDPQEDPEFFRDMQLDRLQCEAAYAALYEANYAFDLQNALQRVQAPSLVIELCVPPEEHLGRQATPICAMMRNATAVSFPFNDKDLLWRQPATLIPALRGFVQGH